MGMQLAGDKGLPVPRRRVLVIDDSDGIRAVLRSMLEENSMQVVEAKDGAQALGQLQSDPAIGLVFLDMNMPDMDGLEVLRQIRADARLTDLPVVVLTGASISAVGAARSLGAVGWMQKPVRVDAVLKVARTFLG